MPRQMASGEQHQEAQATRISAASQTGRVSGTAKADRHKGRRPDQRGLSISGQFEPGRRAASSGPDSCNVLAGYGIRNRNRNSGYRNRAGRGDRLRENPRRIHKSRPGGGGRARRAWAIIDRGGAQRLHQPASKGFSPSPEILHRALKGGVRTGCARARYPPAGEEGSRDGAARRPPGPVTGRPGRGKRARCHGRGGP